MIDKVTAKECYLCKACGDVCPTDAIDFSKEDHEFYYPQINSSKCINCNMCEKVCPALGELPTPQDNYPKSYAARSRNLDIRLKSTSGGLFYELATMIIKSGGGEICGAVFNEDFKVIHKIVDKQDDVKNMCGSKYVQSDMRGIFREIKSILQSGRKVLFCGCPCQTAALKQYMKVENDNLILVDFICHGIPSQKFFDAYKGEMEKKYESKIKDVYFRNKSRGWHSSSVKINFDNGRTYQKPITTDAYMKAFLSGTIMKERCYECQMKDFHSGSDITLGDFWGAEAVLPELDDNKGLSAVFINSEKGLRLFENLDIDKCSVDKEEIIKYNRNVRYSTKMNPKRKEFYEYCKIKGVGGALLKFFGETKYEEFKRELKYKMRCIRNKLQGKEKPLY